MACQRAPQSAQVNAECALPARSRAVDSKCAPLLRLTLSNSTRLFTFSLSLPLDHFCGNRRCPGSQKRMLKRR